MKLEKAYSVDTKENITAEEADRRYSVGEITSKFAFMCPDDLCEAAVTCANLDKPKVRRKRDPYYKVVGGHHPDCLIRKDIEHSARRRAADDDIYSDSDEYMEGAVRLNLSPASAKRPDEHGEGSYEEDMTSALRPQHVSEEGKRRVQRSKTLSSMVDAFLNHENIIVQLPGTGTLPIQDLFIELNGQEISDFEDEYRVYHGKAWINKHDKGYVVRFTNSLKHSGLETQPTFFIPQELVEQAPYKKFSSFMLDKHADKYPKHIFILSETAPYSKDRYINFWLDGLEYMDYRNS